MVLAPTEAEKLTQNFILDFDEFYPKYPKVYQRLSNNIHERFINDPEKDIFLIKTILENGSKECQLKLIKDRTLIGIISEISKDKTNEEVEQKDLDLSRLFLSLKHCSNSATRIIFINKNLDFLKTITNNRLFLYQKFAAENLKNAPLPNSLGQSEDEFYNILVGAINQLTDIQEKIELSKTVFKYFKVISTDKQNDFVQHLKKDVTALDANFSKYLIDLIEPVEIDYKIKEEIWVAVMERSLTLQENEILERVFGHYNEHEEIDSFFSRLTEQNVDKTIALVKKFKEELSSIASNAIIKSFVSKSREWPFNNQPTLFDIIIEIIELCSPEYKDMFAERLLELVKDTNIDNQQLGLKYIDKIIDKIPESKWEYVSQQLVRTLPSPITQYELRITSNIVEGVLKLQDYLSEEARTSLIGFLLPMAKDNTLSDEFRNKGFEFLTSLERLPRKKIKQVLEELLQVLKTEPKYFDVCSKALHSFEGRYKRKIFWRELNEFEKKHQSN